MKTSIATLPLSELDYELPAGLIAQEPAAVRDGARLLVVRRGEALLLAKAEAGVWEALVTGAGKLKVGTRLVHQDDPGRAVLEAVEPAGEGRWRVRALGPDPAAVEALGEPPLPPYIVRND